jgi:histidinol-phosphate aminotransferase
MARVEYSGGPSIEEVRGRVKAARIHKLSSNENPLGPSPRVLEAMREAMASLQRYPPRGDEQLRQALAAHHGRTLTPEHFTTANSGYEVIDLIGRAFLRAGDAVVISSPTYRAYGWSAERQEAAVVDVRLMPDAFALDIDGMLTVIGERTRLVFLCNPSNPTGALVPAPIVGRLLDRLPDGAVLVADEVYSHYVDDPAFPDSLAHVLEGRPLIVVQSFSKAYGLAGLRLGYAIGRPDLIERIARLRRPFHLGELALRAGVAALADQAHLAASVALAREGRAFLAHELRRLGVPGWPSQANFVLFRPPLPARDVFERLIERGIMVRPTDSNGLPGHLRVSAGLRESNEAFVRALAEVLGEGSPCRD